MPLQKCRTFVNCPSITSIQERVLELQAKMRSVEEAEWRQQWYRSVESSFQEVAHLYPEIESSAISDHNAGHTSMCEPTLDITQLSEEDQTAHRKVTTSRSKSRFIPKDETERMLRLSSTRGITDRQLMSALLLGLPTYAKYCEEKLARAVLTTPELTGSSKRQLKREIRIKQDKARQAAAKARGKAIVQVERSASPIDEGYFSKVESVPSSPELGSAIKTNWSSNTSLQRMTHKPQNLGTLGTGGEHRPLVVGLTKPPSVRHSSTMATSSDAAALNKEIAENVKENTTEAAPADSAQKQQKPKKEKAPKPQKAAPVAAPTSPALIDLRVGHILRCVAHPNADSLYVSTIAMGDEEGTEHTQVDEETGKVVRTVCSGLKAYIPLPEMQNRKVVVVANLKPVNMRSIKSAAMVLAASPRQPEGADPHAADRTVELVVPPESSEAGDKVYFEGWAYGEGKGPEKVLNPKKKQWEAVQPGFYTSDELTVGFNAGVCEEVDGDSKGELVVEGKGKCTVPTLKDAVVR